MKLKLYITCLIILLSIKLSVQHGTKGGSFSGSFSSASSASQSSSYSSSHSGSFSGSLSGIDGNLKNLVGNFANAGAHAGSGGAGFVGTGLPAGSKTGSQAFSGTVGGIGSACGATNKNCNSGVKTAGSATSGSGSGSFGQYYDKQDENKPINGKIPENEVSGSDEDKVTFTSNQPKSEIPVISVPGPEPDNIRFEGNTQVPPLLHDSVTSAGSGNYINNGNGAVATSDSTNVGKTSNSGSFPGPSGSIYDKKPASSVPQISNPYPSHPTHPAPSGSYFGPSNPNLGTTTKAPCCKGPFPGPSGSIHDSKPATSVPPAPTGTGIHITQQGLSNTGSPAPDGPTNIFAIYGGPSGTQGPTNAPGNYGGTPVQGPTHVPGSFGPVTQGPGNYGGTPVQGPTHVPGSFGPVSQGSGNYGGTPVQGPTHVPGSFGPVTQGPGNYGGNPVQGPPHVPGSFIIHGPGNYIGTTAFPPSPGNYGGPFATVPEKPVKTQCCKGPFPGPTGSIHESKPASSVPAVPSGPGYVPVQTPSTSGSYGTSNSGSNVGGGYTGVQPPCCKGPFPGPTGSIHEGKPATSVPAIKPSYPGSFGGNKPTFGYFGSTVPQTSSAGSASNSGGYYNPAGPKPQGVKPQVGTGYGPADKHPLMPAFGFEYPEGESKDLQNPSITFEQVPTKPGFDAPNSGSLTKPVDSFPSSTGGNYATGNVAIQKPTVPSATNVPNYSGSGSTSGSNVYVQQPDKSTVGSQPVSSYPTGGNNGFATGTVSIYKPDGTISTGKDTPSVTSSQASDNSGTQNGNAFGSSGSNAFGASGSVSGDVSIYKPDGSVTSSKDKPSITSFKPSDSNAFGSSTSNVYGPSGSTGTDGFVSGGVSIYKPDGTVTSGKDKPAITSFKPSDSNTFGSSTSNAYGSSGSTGNDGFVSGDVSIYKPDGSVTNGKDKPIITSFKPSDSFVNGAAGSGSNTFGASGSSGGFATGDVSIYKPDGTVTGGKDTPSVISYKPSGDSGASFGSSGANTGSGAYGVKGGHGSGGFGGSFSSAGAFSGSGASYGGSKSGSYANAQGGADVARFLGGFLGKNGLGIGYGGAGGGSFAKAHSFASSSSFAGASSGSYSGHY